jgi:hypothetical protein
MLTSWWREKKRDGRMTVVSEVNFYKGSHHFLFSGFNTTNVHDTCKLFRW